MSEITDVYFERPYGAAKWDTEYNGVYVKLKGFVQGDALREVLEKGLDLSKARKAVRWMVDLSEQSVTSLADQEWIAKEFIPRCLASGVTHGALVLPESVIAQMGVNRVHTIHKTSDLGPATFFSVAEARQWLRAN